MKGNDLSSSTKKLGRKEKLKCHALLPPFLSFCQKRNQKALNLSLSLFQRFCLGTKNASVQTYAALLTGSPCGWERGSEANKQGSELAVGGGVRACVCMCTHADTYVCVHAHTCRHVCVPAHACAPRMLTQTTHNLRDVLLKFVRSVTEKDSNRSAEAFS